MTCDKAGTEPETLQQYGAVIRRNSNKLLVHTFPHDFIVQMHTTFLTSPISPLPPYFYTSNIFNNLCLASQSSSLPGPSCPLNLYHSVVIWPGLPCHYCTSSPRSGPNAIGRAFPLSLFPHFHLINPISLFLGHKQNFASIQFMPRLWAFAETTPFSLWHFSVGCFVCLKL